jgi:hypothetical protein
MDRSKLLAHPRETHFAPGSSVSVRSLRPAVISSELESDLGEFLRFRHLFRSVYGFVLQADRLGALQAKLPAALERLLAEVRAFVSWLTGETDASPGA